MLTEKCLKSIYFFQERKVNSKRKAVALTKVVDEAVFFAFRV